MDVQPGANNVAVYYFTINGNKANNPSDPSNTGSICNYSGGDVAAKGYQTFFDSITVNNAPGIALACFTWCNVQNSSFGSAYLTAIWVSSAATGGTLYNNTFNDNGANGIEFSGDNGTISYNIFYRNHRGCPFWRASPAQWYNGGQLLVDPTANSILLLGNILVGGPSSCDTISTSGNGSHSSGWAEGLELYSSNLTVTNNSISNHGGHGVQIGGVR